MSHGKSTRAMQLLARKVRAELLLARVDCKTLIPPARKHAKSLSRALPKL